MVTARVALARAREREERVGERFLSWPRAIGIGLFLLFATTFDEGQVHEDGLVYFAFMRKVFGADTPAVAYQFGSAFWNAPFYLVSQLVALRGGFGSYHAGEIATAVASNAAVVATLYFGWRLLRALDLPRGPVVLLLTLFGTPLYYYGAFWVSYKHAADTLYATALLWFVLRSTRADARRRDFVGMGICLALLVATRYANAAFLAVLVGLPAFGYRRAARWGAAVGAVVATLLFVLPVIRHIPYAAPTGSLAVAAERYALGAPSFIHPVSERIHFSASVPLKMLFTLKRGIFLWTPLTAFATIGFVLLVRRLPRERAFLVAAGASAVALLAIHSLWGYYDSWTGGGSFSQRFLTALFPLFLLGTAELIRRFRTFATFVLTLCALFSLFVGFTLFNGYYQGQASDSLTRVIGNYKSLTGPPVNRYHKPPPYDSVQNLGREIDARIDRRWSVLWRALNA